MTRPRGGYANLQAADYQTPFGPRLMRVSFCSRLLAVGLVETEINKMQGHNTSKIKARYTHSSEQSRRHAVEALARNC